MNEEVMEQRTIIRYDGESLSETDDQIASEYAMTIYVNGEEFATMVCTPSHLEELVIGFLASEGMIRRVDEIESLEINEDRGFAYAELVNKTPVGREFHSKRFIGSCCGKSRQFYFQNDVKTAKTIAKKSTIPVKNCLSLMKQMQESSTDFQKTGGLHNAALCSTDDIVIAHSDIGRHNALDKIYGHCLKKRIPLKGKVIVFSGRISSEVLLKVSKIGVGIVLSKSAPTTLAIELAHDLGITACGFIRGNSLNIYSHSDRITE